MGLTHEDIVVNTDVLCEIDIHSRKIVNKTKKVDFLQYDHNSERVGFTMERYVDGHDMSMVDRVAIKYLNVRNDDMYIVDDLAVTEDGKYITFTWLVSSNVTQEIGSLIFLVNFRCYNDAGVITYNWSTQPCSSYSISRGVESMDSNPKEQYDFWAKYRGLVDGVIEDTQRVGDQLAVVTEDAKTLTAISNNLEPIVDELSKDVPVLESKVNSLNGIADALVGKVAALDKDVSDYPIHEINTDLVGHESAIKLGCTERNDWVQVMNQYASVNNKALASIGSYYTYEFDVKANEVYIIDGVSQGDAALYLFVPADTSYESVVFPTTRYSEVTSLSNVFVVPSEGKLYLCGRTGQTEPRLLIPFDNANLEKKVDKTEFDKHSSALIGGDVSLNFESQYYSLVKHEFVTLSQYAHATVNVNAGDMYFVSGSCTGDMCLYAFISESGTITTLPSERIGQVRYDDVMFVAEENGVLYVNMCRYSDADVHVKRAVNKDLVELNSRVEILEHNAATSVWNGCKANFIGDSIVYGSYGNLVGKIAERLGLSVARNYGIGGSRMARTQYDSQYTPVVLRYMDMSDDADIIVVAAGTNDYSTQVPIGDPDSTDMTTFNGALNTIMDGLRKKYPDKLVVFTSILHRYNDKSLPITVDRYREAIAERCEAKHFVFYDSYRYSGFDFAKDYYAKVLTDDGLHPNEKGVEILARKIAGFLNWQ